MNPQVMHETVDGETIIIDLSTGTYYSLRGSGPAIWDALAQGAGSSTVVETLECAYDAAPGVITAAVEEFLRQLEAERLVAPGEKPSRAPTGDDRAQREPFSEPQLEKYDDLQDIILLDPVHRVDDAGWPQAAPAVADGA